MMPSRLANAADTPTASTPAPIDDARTTAFAARPAPVSAPKAAAPRRRAIFATLASAVLAASLFAMTSCQTQNAQSGLSNGQTGDANAEGSTQAPELTLPTADGGTVTLSELQGKTVFLSFWGTWCPYCIQDMPELQQIKDEFDDVEVVMVNCGESAQDVADFAAEKGYDFIWALDEDYAAQQDYFVSGLPYTAVIAPDGELVRIFEGSYRDGMYDHFVEAVKLAQQ